MTIQAKTRPQPHPEWVMVANAARARCFERDPETSGLRELAGFVHAESRLKAAELGDDAPGHAFKSGATTAFEPHTPPHEREREQFARELAAHLEEAALAHRFDRLALIASNPFLGELRAQLGDAVRRCVIASHPRDLTGFTGEDLERRVTEAMSGHSV
jgi:protein required for attachment to host cells